MINPNHLLTYVIKPVLQELGMNSEAAQRLLLETAMQESLLCHLDQIDKYDKPGPAFGIYQIEQRSHDDIWRNWLDYNPKVARVVRSFSFQRVPYPDVDEMHGNLYYATAMARIYYRRVKEPLPLKLELRADYWKKYYNTHLGAGTPAQYLKNAHKLYQVVDISPIAQPEVVQA